MSGLSTVITTATGRHFTVREADPTDEPGIQALFEAGTEYFEVATGLPPGPADVQSLYYSLPPSADPQDKHILVVTEEYREDATPFVAGIVDVVLRHPSPDACAVGLFLLHPSLWGTSLGPSLAARLLDHAAATGIRRVTATVPREWRRGRGFLSSLSFTFADPPPSPGDRNGNRTIGPREPALDHAQLLLADRQRLRP